MAEFDVVSFLFGAAMKARERAEEELDEWIKKGENWARDWKENVNMRALEKKDGDENSDSGETSDDPLKKIRAGIKDAVRSLGVPAADDLKDLESRIDRLSAKLEKKHR